MIELGGLIAGPYAASLFAQFGADVIKVEPPGEGDPLRRWRKLHNGTSLWWYSLSRNKKSITLNLKSDEGRRIRSGARREGRRRGRELPSGHARGVGARVGRSLPYQSRADPRPHLRLRTDRPVSRPAWVRRDCRSRSAGCATSPDTRIGRRCAWVSAWATRWQRCTRSSARSSPCTIETSTAARDRWSTPRSMRRCSRSWRVCCPNSRSRVSSGERSGASLPGISPSNTYTCRDGGYVVIGGNSDGIFKRLVRAIGRPDLAEDPALAHNEGRVARNDEIDAAISEWTSQPRSGRSARRARTRRSAGREDLFGRGHPRGRPLSASGDDRTCRAAGWAGRRSSRRSCPSSAERLDALRGLGRRSGRTSTKFLRRPAWTPARWRCCGKTESFDGGIRRAVDGETPS